jgi:hypothetical protein
MMIYVQAPGTRHEHVYHSLLHVNVQFTTQACHAATRSQS